MGDVISQALWSEKSPSTIHSDIGQHKNLKLDESGIATIYDIRPKFLEEYIRLTTEWDNTGMINADTFNTKFSEWVLNKKGVKYDDDEIRSIVRIFFRTPGTTMTKCEYTDRIYYGLRWK